MSQGPSLLSQGPSLVLIAVVLVAMVAWYWWRRLRSRRRWLELTAMVCAAGSVYAYVWAVIEGVGWLKIAGLVLLVAAVGLQLLQFRRDRSG